MPALSSGRTGTGWTRAATYRVRVAAIQCSSGSCYVRSMRERGEGSAGRRRGWLTRGRRIDGLCRAVLFGGMLLGATASLAACANSDDSATRVVQAESSRPQQVVQRIEPALGVAPSAGADAARAEQTHAEPAAKAASATNGAAPRDARGSAQAVTAKHVEAELNRLEAELMK
jgi:hypothetical protein